MPSRPRYRLPAWQPYTTDSEGNLLYAKERLQSGKKTHIDIVHRLSDQFTTFSRISLDAKGITVSLLVELDRLLGVHSVSASEAHSSTDASSSKSVPEEWAAFEPELSLHTMRGLTA